MAQPAAEKLVRMANQIADFFRPYPEDEAVAGVRDHLHAFWTPGMLQSLHSRAAASVGGIDPIVQRALTAAPAGESPLEKEVGRDSVGTLASDAG